MKLGRDSVLMPHNSPEIRDGITFPLDVFDEVMEAFETMQFVGIPEFGGIERGL